MADNSSRTIRRDAEPSPRDSLADPLAELARLIGQSDAHGGRGLNGGQSAEAFDGAAPSGELDWSAADEEYAPHASGAQETYAPPRPPEAYAAQPTGDAPWTLDRDYDDEPRPAASRPPPVPYIPPAHGGYQIDEQGQHGTAAPAYAADEPRGEYADEAPPARRSGTIVIVALLGLAVLGTAGALGYRAMFGGSVIPSLPPIIKPGNTPIKIVPKHDAQAGAPNQVGAKGAPDQLVNHEEKPVDIQSANPVPRVVATIPVISNAPDAPVPGAQLPPAAQPAQAAPPPAIGAPNNPQQPFGATDQLVTPGQTPPPGAKAVHTVIIRPDQPPAANPTNAAAPAPVAHSVRPRQPVTRAATREPESRSASAGPLSIVPVQEDRTPPAPRTRTAMVRSSAPMPLSSPSAEAAPSGAGRYAVQVSSQRSEAEAQAAFRSLQAKYPQQLGGRHAVVRRADLGAKGVYYRALVGPFASAEQAASLCSRLKAAGGNCVIQRN